MSARERAAAIVTQAKYAASPIHGPRLVAALDAAGLLVTDDARAALDALAAYDADPDMEFETVMATARPYLDTRRA